MVLSDTTHRITVLLLFVINKMATMLQLGNNSILFLIIVFFICLSIINAQDATTVAAVEESETIWSSCHEEFKKSKMAAKDVKVFVNQCPPVNGSETRCKLTKGIDAVLKIQFSMFF